MSGSTSACRAARKSVDRSNGLLTAQNVRTLAARAARPGTPGLIGSGPGFAILRLERHHCEFSDRARSLDAADFAANLIRAGVAEPEDWTATRDLSKFLNQTLVRFVGERATTVIDYAFDLALTLSPTIEHNYSFRETEIDPRRVLLTFRVASTVSWVNLTPVLTLLEKEHELLPTFFYHSLERSLSRWFRVFDIREAREKWDMWMDGREQDEAERKEECEREGVPYEPASVTEPTLPSSVQASMPKLPRPPASLARSARTKKLMEAVQTLSVIARRAKCPGLNREE